MIGIVLVTHGSLACEFLATLEHVMGPQQCVAAVCINPDDDMHKRREEILENVRACDTSEGVIVLTDMFGGTPVQPRHLDHGAGPGRDACRRQSADAGEACLGPNPADC